MKEKFEDGASINEFGEIIRPSIKRKKHSTNVIEVPSKKTRKGSKVNLEVAIKDLPRGEKDIENLIAGVKRNGENVKKPIIAISGFMSNFKNRFIKTVGPKIRQTKKKNEENKKINNKENEKEKKKFNPKALIPIGVVLVVAIPIFLRGCDNTERPGPIPEPTSITEKSQEPTIPSDQEIEIMVREEEKFDIEIYDINNPYEILEGIVNSEGQEGLTANGIDGEGFKGSYYNDDEQFLAEEKASGGVQHFIEIKDEINNNMQILIDSNKSSVDKKIAVQRLLELNQEVETIFSENQEFAEEYAEKFAEASKAFEDTNTENEIITVNGMVENFKSELGLSSHNVGQIMIINQLLEQDYELEITNTERDLRGTYEISGNAIKNVIKKVNLNEAEKLWSNFATATRGKSMQNETTTQTNEREEM